MSLVAYGLRAEYDGTVEQEGDTVPLYTGGVIRAGDRDLNIREELDAGGGRILVHESDVAALLALDEYPALKRVSVGDADPEQAISRHADRPMSELRAELAMRGLASASSKDAAVERLEAHDAALEEGDAIAAASPTPEQPEPTPGASSSTPPEDPGRTAAPPDYPADAEQGSSLDSSPEPDKGGNTPET